jgi:hypothetical protein
MVSTIVNQASGHGAGHQQQEGGGPHEVGGSGDWRAPALDRQAAGAALPQRAGSCTVMAGMTSRLPDQCCKGSQQLQVARKY